MVAVKRNIPVVTPVFRFFRAVIFVFVGIVVFLTIMLFFKVIYPLLHLAAGFYLLIQGIQAYRYDNWANFWIQATAILAAFIVFDFLVSWFTRDKN